MKSLIHKILKEEGFDWATSIPSYDDMKIDWEDHVLPYLTGQRPTFDEEGNIEDFDRWPEISGDERADLEPLAKHYFVRQLNDIDFKDGKFLMTVGSWGEFAELFKDCDYQGYICKYTAESVLGEEDYWEPYHDVVYDWEDQVWESVDGESRKLIVDHIKRHCVGDRVEMEDYGEVELTDSLITSWTSEDHILGQMVSRNDGGCFEDLKNSMRWWYEDAYNTAARDEYWNSTHGAITEVFGEGEWEEYEVKKMGGTATRHQLVFNVTSIFMEVIESFYEDYCELDYDHECELEYSDFLDNLRFLMNEEVYMELLNPRVSEYPDDDKVKEYFNEKVREELG
jgi:hypothetical protein